MSREDLYEEIISLMTEIGEDTTVPRNIRREIVHAKETLMEEDKPLDVRVASAIFELDEVANDPNIPVHGRTVVYMIMGKLETLSKELSP